MRLFILSACFILSAGLAQAGQLDVSQDEKAGLIKTYSATVDEAVANSVAYSMSVYDKINKSVFIVLTPVAENTVLDCANREVSFQSVKGETHTIKAQQGSPDQCMATIPVDWVKEKFTVALPLGENKPNLMATFETSSLNIEDLSI
jgi:hypothetical protein